MYMYIKLYTCTCTCQTCLCTCSTGYSSLAWPTLVVSFYCGFPIHDYSIHKHSVVIEFSIELFPQCNNFDRVPFLLLVPIHGYLHMASTTVHVYTALYWLIQTAFTYMYTYWGICCMTMFHACTSHAHHMYTCTCTHVSSTYSGRDWRCLWGFCQVIPWEVAIAILPVLILILWVTEGSQAVMNPYKQAVVH